MDRRHGVGSEAGYTLLELMVASTLLLAIVAAVGTALGTGGQVYGDGLLRSELNSTARGVLNRILYELEATRSDGPDFAVNGSSITYNRVEGISATTATFGSARTIAYGNDGTVKLTIAADGVTEPLTDICSGLTFVFNDGLLTVTVEVVLLNAAGETVTQTVSGDMNIAR